MSGVAADPSIYGLRGNWVTLEPVGQSHRDELRDLDERRRRVPGMGGFYQGPHLSGRYGAAMAVRDNRTGRTIGVVENGEMIGYPGVAVVVVYVDPQLARAGVAIEAYGIYMPTLFAQGARILHIEVLSFNRDVTRLFDRRGYPPQVRMRRQVYVAGHYWDLMIYGFDQEQWAQYTVKLRRVLPGGQRPMAAIGGRRPEQ